MYVVCFPVILEPSLLLARLWVGLTLSLTGGGVCPCLQLWAAACVGLPHGLVFTQEALVLLRPPFGCATC